MRKIGKNFNYTRHFGTVTNMFIELDRLNDNGEVIRDDDGFEVVDIYYADAEYYLITDDENGYRGVEEIYLTKLVKNNIECKDLDNVDERIIRRITNDI